MSYFYGPVHSRRLGYSLGVSLVPKKSCTFDCIYCQVGSFSKTKIKRANYIDLFKFKRELREVLAKEPRIDYITLSGSGEPTLHKDLDKIIKAIKKVSKNKYPVSVITNSSFLYRKKVRQELKEADLLIPSLDAPDAETFKKINRPHSRIELKKIINGLIDFRREFKGKIWLEIMIVGGVNDNLEGAHKFKKIISQIQPDKVQINLPVRPSAERVPLPQTRRVEKIKRIINRNIEVVAD